MPTLADEARARTDATTAAGQALRNHNTRPTTDPATEHAAAQRIVACLYEVRARRGLGELRALTNDTKVSDFRRKVVERAPGSPTTLLSHNAFFHATFAASQALVSAYGRR